MFEEIFTISGEKEGLKYQTRMVERSYYGNIVRYFEVSIYRDCVNVGGAARSTEMDVDSAESRSEAAKFAEDALRGYLRHAEWRQRYDSVSSTLAPSRSEAQLGSYFKLLGA